MAQPPSAKREVKIFVVSTENQELHENSSKPSTNPKLDSSLFEVTLTKRYGEKEQLYHGNTLQLKNYLTSLVALLDAQVAPEITDNPVLSIQIKRDEKQDLQIHVWKFRIALIDSEEDIPTNLDHELNKYPPSDFVICLNRLSNCPKDESILRHAILKLLMAQKTLKLLDLTLLHEQLTENEWEDIIGPQIECLTRIRLGDDYAGNLMTVYARAPVFRCLILDFSGETVRLGLSVE